MTGEAVDLGKSGRFLWITSLPCGKLWVFQAALHDLTCNVAFFCWKCAVLAPLVTATVPTSSRTS